jgi:hypothetical protein
LIFSAETRPGQIKSSRNLGCFGWLLIWLGVALLLRENWGLAWAGLAISIGIVYLVRAIRDPGQEGAVLPGVILLVTGATILSQLQGWTTFDVWRVWPIFFGSIGLGLTLRWALGDGSTGTLTIGGVFLIAFGYGIASPSWYRYLRDLRHFFDYWPLLIAIIGLVLLFGHWKRRNQGSSQ